MRTFVLSLLLASLGAPLLAAQSTPRWALSLGASRDAFTGASTDTTSLPGSEVEVGPTARVAVEIGLTRALGSWELSLGAGYAPGGLRAKSGAVLVEDGTSGIDRYRLALLVGRRIATLDRAELIVLVGPGIDHWESSGIMSRTTLSGRGGLALRVPLGGLSFENRAMFGIGESPFHPSSLPPGATVRSVRTWSLGAALRIPI